MPRTMPTGCAAEFRKLHRPDPVHLLDVLTVNGTTYYWSDYQGAFPARISGSTPLYQPFIVSAGPFQFSRSLAVDAGDIVVQNISGSTIERDVITQMCFGEFEGALAIYRMWDVVLQAALFEFHGTLTEQGGDYDTEMQFRCKQLLDPNLVDVPFEDYSEKCSLLYKGIRCGSTSVLTTCPLTVAGCIARTALARFTGIPSTPPLTQASPLQYPPKPTDGPRWRDRRPWE